MAIPRATPRYDPADQDRARRHIELELLDLEGRLTSGGVVTPTAHAVTHQDGGSDEVNVGNLSGELADAQKHTVRKNSGADVGTRRRTNYIEGTNVVHTIADDAGGNEIDLTTAAPLAGASGDLAFNAGAGVFGADPKLNYDNATDQLTAPGLNVDEDFALRGDISPAQLTSDQNDYNPTNLATSTVLRVNGDASFRSITGLAGGADGRVLYLVNVGTNNLRLSHEDAASSAANRFNFGAKDIALAPGDVLPLLYDATSARWRSSFRQRRPNAREGFAFYRDVLSNVVTAITGFDTETTVFVSGTGSLLAILDSIAGHPGIVRYTLDNSGSVVSVHSQSMLGGTPRCIVLGSSWMWEFEAWFRIDVLSNGTNRYQLQIGFIDTIGPGQGDGLFFRYTDNVNGGNWQGVAEASAAETVLNSSTPAATGWNRLRVLQKPNGNSEFFVNDVSIGTISGGLPVNSTAFGVMTTKTAGNDPVTFDLDAIDIIGWAPSAR